MSKKISMDTMDITELSKQLEDINTSGFSLDDILNENKPPKPKPDNIPKNQSQHLHTKNSINIDKESKQESKREQARDNPARAYSASNNVNPITKENTQANAKEKSFNSRTGRIPINRNAIGDINSKELYDTEFIENIDDYDNDIIKDPKTLLRKYKKELALYKRRILPLSIIIIISLYISFSGILMLPLPASISYINKPYIHLLILTVLQISAMLLCIDLISDGLLNILKPNVNTIVSLSLISSLIHIVSIILFPSLGGYMSYSSINILALLFLLFNNINKTRNNIYSYKIATISNKHLGVYLDDKIISKGSDVNISEFLSRPLKKTISDIYISLIPVFCTVATVLIVFITKNYYNIFLMLSAMLTASIPFSLINCNSSPMKNTAKKLLKSGANIRDIPSGFAKNRNVILNDNDFFSANDIQISALNLPGQYDAETVIAFTAAIYKAAKTTSAKVFTDLLYERYGTPVKCENITHYKNGGFGGTIEGYEVLAGTAPFIIRMGISLTEGRDIKNGVFVAINGKLAGIFALKYTANSSAYVSLHTLMRKPLNLICATRDFNITPSLINKVFDFRRSNFQYPDINTRIELSVYDSGELSAIISRDTTGLFLSVIKAGRRLYYACLSTQIISIISGIIGTILMSYLMYNFHISAANPYNTLIYLSLWYIPCILISNYCKK